MTIPPLLFSVWLADHYYYNMGGFLFLLIAKASLNPWQSQGFSEYNKKFRLSKGRNYAEYSAFGLAQWVGFEPTSLKGHHDFEQIIKLPIWSLIVLKKRRFSLILSTFLREFGNLREKCEKTARNFRRLKRKMKGKSDHEQGRKA